MQIDDLRPPARKSRSGRRRGAALLEVIAALTILAAAGAAAIANATDAARTVRRARESEDVIRRASALFDAVALWPREDLDRHLGARVQGDWRMHIDRPTPMLYVIILADRRAGRELLRTVLYRPEPIQQEVPDAGR